MIKTYRIAEAFSFFISSLFIILVDCSCSTNNLACNTYNGSGSCTEKYIMDSFTVCAKNDSEASWVIKDLIFKKYNCYPDSVNAYLDQQGFCQYNPGCEIPSDKTSALLAFKSAYATFDGLVDPNKSWFAFTNLDDNNKAVVNVEGEVSVTGGNCTDCSFQITHASLKSTKGFSISGKQVTELRALNHGVWSGYKYSDDSFAINSPSYISISGKLDGKYTSSKAQADSYIKGKFSFVDRPKDVGKKVGTNSFIIDGNFVENNISVKMHLHIWMSDCRPEIVAEVSCVQGIDYEPLYVRIDGLKGKMLPNADQKDLCNAYKTKTIYTVCGSDEFIFTCFKGSENVSGKLNYRWEDANVNLISADPFMNLKNCPTFPISLTVSNEWGHVAKKVISSAPDLGKCSKLCKPEPMILFFNPSECEDITYFKSHKSDCLNFEDLIKEDINRNRLDKKKKDELEPKK